WPEEALRAALSRYSGAETVVWCQEEPANMGPYTFVRERLSGLLAAGQGFRYAGRVEAASPAVGSNRVHRSEQFRLVSTALGRA
ncbi:MAG: hypothetical protein AAEJ53_17725, partial [Myxococcota bacterium]